MPQTVEHDTWELRVGVLPFEELLADQHRLHRQTVGQTEQHSAVMVTCRVFHLVCRQLIQPFLQFLFQRRGHEDGAAGGCRFGTFQDEGSGAAFQLVREYLDDAAIVHLAQGFFSHPLHGLVDIGDGQVLDGGKIGFVGLGCPLVLVALLGQPVHEELCHRHGGWDQESASGQFMLDLLFSVRCLLLGGKAFPFVAALTVFIFVGVADAVRVAALRNICHTVASLSSCPVEPRIEAVLRYADASAYPQDTEFGDAVAQVVIRISQFRSCQADSNS